MIRALGALLWVAVCVIGCGNATAPAERVSTHQDALAIRRSAPFDLVGKPEYQAASTNDGHLACGSTRCVVAYSQSLAGGGYSYFSRVGFDGVPQDAPRFLLGPSGGVQQVIARGDEFLVVWGGLPKITRINGATGAADDVSAQLAGGYIGASSSDGYIFVNADLTSTRIYDASLTLLGSVSLATGTHDGLQIVAGPGQYLVFWNGGAQRIDAKAATLLDTAAIAYSRYSHGFPSAAYVNGVYQIGWVSQGDVYGSRIRASDGVVLDPDDTFNQKSGAKLLCARCSADQTNTAYFGDLSVSAFASKALFVWSHNPIYGGNWFLYGAQVDPSTGLRADGVTNAAAVATSTPVHYFQLSLAEGKGVLLNHDNPTDALRGFNATTEPLALTSTVVSSPAILSPTMSMPALASNGTDFFAAWVANGRVRGTRIDGMTGMPLDDPAIDFGAGATPAVAAAGSDYLVAWINPSAAYAIGRRLVQGADGSLGAVLPTILSRATYESGTDQLQTRVLRLVNNGANFCLAWIWGTDVRGVRLDSNGAALDSSYVRLINGVYSDSYALLADRAPTPDMRTFVLVASTQSGGSIGSAGTVTVRRWRSQTGALIDLTSAGKGDGVRGATGAGDKMVIEYVVVPNYSTYVFNTVQPVDGTVVDTRSKLDLAGSSGVIDSLWYDGKSFVQLINNNFGLSARRYATDLTALESATPVTGTPISVSLSQYTFDHAVVGTSSGRSLVAFQQVDTIRSGTTLKGIFLDNDGQPAPATGTGGTGGSDGTGGTAGAGGSGGTGGSGITGTGGAIASGGLPTTFDGGSAGEPNEAGALGFPAGGTRAASGGNSSQSGPGTSGSRAAAGDAAIEDTAGEPTGGSSSPSGSKLDSGCGCRVGTTSTGGRGLAFSLIGLCSVFARRRWRRAPKRAH